MPYTEQMKPRAFTPGTTFAVVNADQRHSRRNQDAVGSTIEALTGQHLDFVLPPVRTMGDQWQCLTTSPRTLTQICAQLSVDNWHVGIGIGTVDQPLPDDSREARGPAYLLARQALEGAGRSPLVLAEGHDPDAAPLADLNATLALVWFIWNRRSPQGWQVSRAVQNHRPAQVASMLDISASAVSQRLATAGHEPVQAGVAMLDRLWTRLLQPQDGAPSDRSAQ